MVPVVAFDVFDFVFILIVVVVYYGLFGIAVARPFFSIRTVLGSLVGTPKIWPFKFLSFFFFFFLLVYLGPFPAYPLGLEDS